MKDSPLLHVENFLHHSETLAGLKAGHGLKILGHFRLPAQVHRVGGQRIPGGVEILHAHDQDQVLVAAKDTPHKFENLGPGPLVTVDIHENGSFVTEWLE